MSQLYGESDDGFDSWEAMDKITQDTRANIVADIVGHPKGMPSMTELDFTNPSVNRSAINEHLEKLREASIVGKAEIPVGERSRDLPHVFYYITEDAWDFFDRNNLFDRDTWQDQYAKVDKTPEIQRVQEMERPDRD